MGCRGGGGMCWLPKLPIVCYVFTFHTHRGAALGIPVLSLVPQDSYCPFGRLGHMGSCIGVPIPLPAEYTHTHSISSMFLAIFIKHWNQTMHNKQQGHARGVPWKSTSVQSESPVNSLSLLVISRQVQSHITCCQYRSNTGMHGRCCTLVQSLVHKHNNSWRCTHTFTVQGLPTPMCT